MSSDRWMDGMDDAQMDAMTDVTNDELTDSDFIGISCRSFTMFFSPLLPGTLTGFQLMVME